MVMTDIPDLDIGMGPIFQNPEQSYRKYLIINLTLKLCVTNYIGYSNAVGIVKRS